jgi:endonuclease/exonuclease/phosphatase family metal-dependent hydrolase
VTRYHRLLVLVALLLAPTIAWAQTVTPVGSPDRLDVATWNIEWFGSATNGPNDLQRQFNNVRAIIEGSDIDLWAVQEISNPNMFRALLDSLGEGFDGRLATYSQTQKIGFIYRTDVITPQATLHVLSQYSADFAGRPPLELRATVALPDTTISVTFLVVHLKAFSDVPSYNQRRQASLRLQTYIDAPQEEESFMILGDFNDRLTTSTTSGMTSPFTNFIDEPHRYNFVTYAAEERGEASWTGSSSFAPSMIDHILINAPLFDAYVEESAQVWSTLPRTFIGFTTTVSDHLPVYASFDFRTTTSIEDIRETASSIRIDAVYPNPTSGPVTISVATGTSSRVSIDILDVTGRVVRTIDSGGPGTGAVNYEADLGDLASGLYFVRVQSDFARYVRPISVVR